MHFTSAKHRRTVNLFKLHTLLTGCYHTAQPQNLFTRGTVHKLNYPWLKHLGCCRSWAAAEAKRSLVKWTKSSASHVSSIPAYTQRGLSLPTVPTIREVKLDRDGRVVIHIGTSFTWFLFLFYLWICFCRLEVMLVMFAMRESFLPCSSEFAEIIWLNLHLSHFLISVYACKSCTIVFWHNSSPSPAGEAQASS